MWNAATDNVGVTAYVVYRDGAEIATTPSLAYESTGLSPETPYEFYVTAVDLAGYESEVSNVINVLTLPLADNEAPGGTEQTYYVNGCEIGLSDFPLKEAARIIDVVDLGSQYAGDSETYLVGLATGIRTDSMAGVWEILNDCSVQTLSFNEMVPTQVYCPTYCTLKEKRDGAISQRE
ncbi:MAG: hypothetical protein HC896_16965 [Bacteroidales bacterium]|nr:hypothetical protein [Bacteroidales bacterium]